MAYKSNGQSVHKVVPGPEVDGYSRGMTREERIDQFLKNNLPAMCDKHVFRDSVIINISISSNSNLVSKSPDSDLDVVFVEQRVCKSLLRSSQPEGITRRRRLYVSNNYLAQRQDGKWIINPLLLQDEWLSQEKVHQAYEQIVRVKKWAKSIEKPVLCDCLVDDVRTVVWASSVEEGDYQHMLVCLPQNGLILIDRSEDEFPIWDDELIRVADCCFRPVLDGEEIVSLIKN